VATSDGFDTSAPLGESSPNRKESVGPFADPEKSQELSKFWSLLRAYGGIRSKV
jgi:hypothetical protein